MKKTFRNITLFALALAMLIGTTLFTGCGKSKKQIIIYTSGEDFRIEYMQQRMKEQFPDYDVIFEYKSSGDHAAILKSAGKNAEAHISNNLEYGYAEELAALGVLADLSKTVDFSGFTEDAATSTFYSPELRNGGAIILNMDVIEEKNLDIPTSYEDLLDPQYKNLISMPNPKASGTGYMFLLNLVNAWGEEEAFAYFDALSENILSFTSSGSGPVNALVGKEVAIGFGMTAQAVQQIAEGENLQIVFFEEGSPYSLYGHAILAGKETDPAVVEVFEFLSTTLTEEMCERFYPEKIYKDKDFVIEHYPPNIVYADMSNNTPERKAELLEKWTH
ncbi:MAG: extracellular solute-binding protein [Clostridia bacterium]|nr:extracellular solute-binding protein [Clostridia bacterium]MBQ3014382.1 extracellular solute-binding protein [Clostridia bacterium]